MLAVLKLQSSLVCFTLHFRRKIFQRTQSALFKIRTKKLPYNKQTSNFWIYCLLPACWFLFLLHFPLSTTWAKTYQIYNDVLVLKKTQNHSCLWSLPEELVCFVGIVTAIGVTAGLTVWMFGLFKGQFKLFWLLARTYVNSYFSVWILEAIVDISVEVRPARHL